MSPRAWDRDPSPGCGSASPRRARSRWAAASRSIPVVSHDAVALELFLAGALTGRPSPRGSRSSPMRAAASSRSRCTTGSTTTDCRCGRPSPRSSRASELDARLAELGAERRDAAAVSAAMVAIVAGRAVAAGRVIGTHRAAVPALARCDPAARTQAGHRMSTRAGHPRRPRRDHGARARIVPDRRLVRRDDARGARLAARLVRRRRRGRAACRLRRAARGTRGSGCRHPDDHDRRGRPRPRSGPGAARRALLEEAARRGVRDVFLEVRADNPVAQALYALGGFRRGRAPTAVLPARRRRRDRDAARPGRVGGRAGTWSDDARMPPTRERAHEPHRTPRARHRDELRRDRHRHRPRPHAAVEHDREQHGRARPLRRRRARGRRPRAPRGAAARRSRRRSPRPGSR